MTINRGMPRTFRTKFAVDSLGVATEYTRTVAAHSTLSNQQMLDEVARMWETHDPGMAAYARRLR